MGAIDRKLYPEIAKHADSAPDRALLEDFFRWLEAQKYELAAWGSEWGNDKLFPITETPSQLMTRYFKIDPAKLERERRALLASASTRGG